MEKNQLQENKKAERIAMFLVVVYSVRSFFSTLLVSNLNPHNADLRIKLMIKPSCTFVFFLSLFLLTLSLSLSGQAVTPSAHENNKDEKQNVAVILFVNNSGGETLDALCSTGTDILETTLRLLNRYTIQRADFLLPTQDFRRARLYLQTRQFDNAIFGSISYSDAGKYVFSVSVWDRVEDEIIIEIERSAGSIFDVFNIVDAITIEVAEAFTGESIGFGTLRVRNTGGEGNYSVYVDGQFIGNNITEQRVLHGRRTVRVTEPAGFGEREIYSTEVVLREGEVSEIAFALEPQQEMPVLADSAPLGRGALLIDTFPQSAMIEFDDEPIGKTPIELFGIPGGRYSIHLSSPGYLPVERIIEVIPDEQRNYNIELQINPISPEFKSLLIDSDPFNRQFWITTGVQAGLFSILMFTESLPFRNEYLLLLAPRLQHFKADSPGMAAFINLLNFSAVAVPMMTGTDGTSSFITLAQVMILFGSYLYDTLQAPRAAERRNEARIERINQTGLEQAGREIQARRELRPDTRSTVQFLGGALISGGISYPFRGIPLRAEVLGGLSFFDPDHFDRFSLTLTTKGIWYLAESNPVLPYTGFLLQAAFDPALNAPEGVEGATGISAGPLFGLEYTTVPLVNAVPFLEAQLIYGIGHKSLSAKFAGGIRF